MATKTDVEVAIGGKLITLSGYESEEYIQKIASYLNNKINEYSKADIYRKLNLDMQHTLLEINIADDLFKAKNQIIAMEEDLRSSSREISDLKHELVNNQMKLQNLEKNIKSLTSEKKELEKKLRENDNKQKKY